MEMFSSKTVCRPALSRTVARGMSAVVQKPEFGRAVRHFKIHGGFEVRVLHAADAAERIPVHLEGAFLERLHPGIVRLVVRIGAGHQFDVRAVVVGEDVVLHAAARAVAPRPEFLAGHNVMIGDADDAGLPAVIVTGEEVVLRNSRRTSSWRSGGSYTSSRRVPAPKSAPL